MSSGNVYRPYLRRESKVRLRGDPDGLSYPPVFEQPARSVGEPRWFAVETLVRKEHVAYRNLLQQNFIVYLPKRLQTTRHARRLNTEQVPLFPGYLFVQLDLARDGWRGVATTPAVRQILSSGGKPVPVRHGVVETLIESSDDNGLLYFIAESRTSGAVRLISGPFASELGILERLDRADRVSFLLSMMNRQVRVSMGVAETVPIS